MVLQPTRRTAEEYRYPRGGLLPRLFTLTSHKGGGRSLLRYYTLTDIKSLACVALCVARTFLPRPKTAAIERVCTLSYYFTAADMPAGMPRGDRSYFPVSGFISLIRSCVLTVPR